VFNALFTQVHAAVRLYLSEDMEMITALQGCAVALATAIVCSGQTPMENKAQEIKKLIEVTGAAQKMQVAMDIFTPKIEPLIRQALESGLNKEKVQNPENLERAVNLIMAEFRKQLRQQDLIERIIPIYAKYFSNQEIHGLIEFYDSPLGRKVVEFQPTVLLEASKQGEAWGQEIAQRVLTEPDLQTRVMEILEGKHSLK
jgi:hypothetical protein